jgi:thiosulfate/3-mercaptopyruvate sulfurtransferase
MRKAESIWKRHKPAMLAITLSLGVLLLAAHRSLSRPAGVPPSNPWKNSQVIEPADLVKALSIPSGWKPAVVCAGFEFLYKAAHIPGAHYAGPGSEAKGLETLKKWAEPQPRNREVVLYCGCCPLAQCPNVRPAFKALKAMGFKNLKVLDLPDNFQKNWVAKGYPIEH